MNPLTISALKEQVRQLNEMARRDQASANHHRDLADAFEAKAEAQRHAADVIDAAWREASA